MTYGSRAGVVIEQFKYHERFKDDLKRLSPELQASVQAALEALKENSQARKLRFERLTDYRNPSIYTIHATANHSHKISMEIDGKTAILRRVATHKEIDRRP